VTEPLLWPRYDGPGDLAAIEQVPLSERGLPASTYDLLVRAATRWPDRPAVTSLPDAERWENPTTRTFRVLLEDVHRVANLLHALGIRRTDAVALLAPNCDELVTATLAAQLAGVAAPLNSALSLEHLTTLLMRSEARVLVAAGPELDAELQPKVSALVALGLLDRVLLLAPNGDVPAQQCSGAFPYLRDLAAGHEAHAFAGLPPQAGDLAALFHTGGTTGLPKLAAHTHLNEVADAWMLSLGEVLDEGATFFAALPLFHVNALVVTALAPLFRGQHVVWAGPLGYRDPQLYGVFWRLVERYRISAMSAVPTVYAVLATVPVDADISSLRVAAVGASPLPAAVRETFETATGVPLLEGYGLTEAACASVRSLPGHRRAGAVGQRLPYQRLRVVAGDGTLCDLPPGEAGLLLISGPTVFPGYVLDRTSEGYRLDGLGKLVDGWLDTGDLATVDQDGFVTLTGRAKDLIIRGGHNLDPSVLEDALLAHPDVTGAAAVGRPDPHAGEVPVAYVTLADGAAVSEDQLRRWAAEHVTERAAAPKAVTVLPALPLTAVGKPFKVPLRADAARQEVSGALDGVDGVVSVEADADDGTVRVTVRVAPGAEEGLIKSVLDRYSLDWRLVVVP
jgi:fatty-acyl-CoA synthase